MHSTPSHDRRTPITAFLRPWDDPHANRRRPVVAELSGFPPEVAPLRLRATTSASGYELLIAFDATLADAFDVEVEGRKVRITFLPQGDADGPKLALVFPEPIDGEAALAEHGPGLMHLLLPRQGLACRSLAPSGDRRAAPLAGCTRSSLTA